jgi:hypothetical protein
MNQTARFTVYVQGDSYIRAAVVAKLREFDSAYDMHVWRWDWTATPVETYGGTIIHWEVDVTARRAG